MTIVLQEQFWGLEVEDDFFSVTLRFDGTPRGLRIPFTALTAFVDPSVPFGVRLAEEAAPAEGQPAPAAREGAPALPNPDAPPLKPADADAKPGVVVDFRPRKP